MEKLGDQYDAAIGELSVLRDSKAKEIGELSAKKLADSRLVDEARDRERLSRQKGDEKTEYFHHGRAVELEKSVYDTAKRIYNLRAELNNIDAIYNRLKSQKQKMAAPEPMEAYRHRFARE